MFSVMSRNARNEIHDDLNKRHKVSAHLSHKLHHHFWREIRTIKVIKCPLNSSPPGDINSNRNPSLNNNPNTDANPKGTTRWFTFRLGGTLRDVYKN